MQRHDYGMRTRTRREDQQSGQGHRSIRELHLVQLNGELLTDAGGLTSLEQIEARASLFRPQQDSLGRGFASTTFDREKARGVASLGNERAHASGREIEGEPANVEWLDAHNAACVAKDAQRTQRVSAMILLRARGGC